MEKQILKNRFYGLIIFLLPLVLLYWMLPFVSGQTLGTDYINYHIFHQLDLLFSVKTGSFPLYAPACYYGQSSVYPHAQLYHPMGYLASLMPGFWQGVSLQWLTLFRLITLAACHFCLFQFLRKMGLNRLMAFILSLITVYNLRMLALFWNAVALEAYTGTLFLCAAIGCYYLKQAGWRGPLLIVGATYWIINSDFPPMVFFGLAGTAAFALTLPFLHNAIIDTEKADLRTITRFWARATLCFSVGAFLSAAYLLPFFLDYMQNSSGRVDQSYVWAAQWMDTLPGFVNNFFLPLGSGFSMFGGSPLFLVAVTAPLILVLFRIRVPAVVWCLYGIIVIVCLYMQGTRTPVHYWAWQHVPLVSALRGPGRISIMLPLLMMMILAWLTGASFKNDPVISRRMPARPVTVAAIAALIMTAVYFVLPDHLFVNSHYGCPYNLRLIPGWVKPAILATSLVILVLLWFFSSGSRKVTGLFLGVLTICQLVVIFHYGPYAVVPVKKTPTYDQIQAQKKLTINFQPVFFLNQHAGNRVVVRQLKNYFMESSLAKIYRRYTMVNNINEVYARLNNDRQPDEVIIEGLAGSNTAPLPSCPLNMENSFPAPDQVKLTYSAYNRLAFSARAVYPSIFVFAYPYSGHWQAWLNGQKVPVFRANGAAHAIAVSAGEHQIEFRYWSNAAFWGMIITCLTLSLLVGLAGIRGIGGPVGYLTATAGLVCAAGLFGFWYTSLYAGDNLGTAYEWHSPLPDAPVNLAFGKPTRMSSHTPGYPYLYNSRHAVDGGRGVDSCFFTDKEQSPWWQVDLRRPAQVGKIVMYTGFSGDQYNQPPLTVSISRDGRQWRKIRIDDLGSDGCSEFVLEPPETLQFLNIKASGECVLSFNEIEIYSPGAE